MIKMAKHFKNRVTEVANNENTHGEEKKSK